MVFSRITILFSTSYLFIVYHQLFYDHLMKFRLIRCISIPTLPCSYLFIMFIINKRVSHKNTDGVTVGIGLQAIQPMISKTVSIMDQLKQHVDFQILLTFRMIILHLPIFMIITPPHTCQLKWLEDQVGIVPFYQI